MNMEEYLEELKGQIRDKYAKDFVTNEVRRHIEDQAETYEREGIAHEEALSKAVIEMGDPVSVGVDLDRIHRPHMEWRFLVYVLFISVLSFLLHCWINRGLDPRYFELGGFFEGVSIKHMLSILIGILAMLLVYRADYTALLGKSRVIGGVYLCIITLLNRFFGYDVNGTNQWIGIGSISFSVHAFLFLYLPIFGGILYECRGKGKSALIQIVFWMIAPILSLILNGDPSTPLYLSILASEALLISFAVVKDWYSVKKKAVFAGLGSAFAVIGALLVGYVLHFNESQRLRIENWLAHFGIGNYVQDNNGMNYINARLGEVFLNSKIVGESHEAVNIIKELPGFRDDLIIGSIAAYCGKFAVAGVIICLLILSLYMFRISVRQKNSLGYIVGCACGIVIALQCISNILIVFGILPLTASVLPLISHGVSACVVDYMLLGLILSIYRYKDIRREKPVVTPILQKVE